VNHPPITFIEMLEALYAASDVGQVPDDVPESDFAAYIEAHGLAVRHEHDPDGLVSVFQGPRCLFRCSEERHGLLSAVIDLEEREYVP